MLEIEFRYKWLEKTREGELEATKLFALTTREEGVDEIMQDFRAFLLAVGFHSDNIDEYIEAN